MSQLRVISGTARGRKLKSVPGDSTRPITDRVKEALFNILGPDIQGATLLDIFAGTGSVGIEALSRGAVWVRLNDRHNLAVKTIKANLELTHLAANAEVLHMDAFSLLEKPPDRRFDYIYIAPPQYQELWSQALRAVDQKTDWLVDDGWIIVQIHPVEWQPITLENLMEFDRRKYGSTLLIFYALKDPAD